MRTTLVVVVSVMLIAGLCGTVVAGSIDSPGAPSSGSGMYSLSQVYDYLNSGIDVTPLPSFQEPGAAPGSTMKTTKQIYEDMKAKFDECLATAADVKSGVKFFCHVSGSWGVRTGTAQVVLTPTPTPTLTPTSTPTLTPTPWCSAKGGYWGPDGLGGYGCWFIAVNRTDSCTSTCSNNQLTCDTRQWNDIGCTACKAISGSAYCGSDTRSWYPILSVVDPAQCLARSGSTALDSCDASGPYWDHHRLCVCMQ
ncbi:MAG: hypothetical protein NTZ78_09550 [Candidatus Aureabacteria bacterium]|nr:hypothetical protein [Candidatus Auribacterota bacterium]